jgi:ribose/xylose/arabinose/galactoside ABC-type transport system permease subunit
MDKYQPIKGLLSSDHNRKLLYKRKSEVVFVYVFLIGFVILASILNSKFLLPRNLRNLLSANVGLLFVTYGQLFVILLGGVDLSVGSVISVVNVICVQLIAKDNPMTWLLALVVALAVGIGVGLINGLLVTKGNMQPIIATLATQTFFAGFALFIQDKPGGTLPSSLCKFISSGWNYMFPLLLLAIVSVLIWLLLNRTRTGRDIIAVGGNAQSAESSGIRVDRVKIKAFVTCSFMAALAGLFITAFSTSGSPLIGEAYSQRSITAAVVGGAALMGGKASTIGCIAAAFILGIVNNILNLQGVSSYYQYVLTGIILMVALTISTLRSTH